MENLLVFGLDSAEDKSIPPIMVIRALNSTDPFHGQRGSGPNTHS